MKGAKKMELEVFNKEKHRCFECGNLVTVSCDAELKIYQMSGLCTECQNAVFEEMYEARVATELQGIRKEIATLNNTLSQLRILRLEGN